MIGGLGNDHIMYMTCIRQRLTSGTVDHALEDHKHLLAGHAQLSGTKMGTWPMPKIGPIASTHQSDWLSYRLPYITLCITMQGNHFPNCTFVSCEGPPIAAPTLDAPYRQICPQRLCPQVALGCSIMRTYATVPLQHQATMDQQRAPKAI